MAKIENGFIVCGKEDPILKFQVPAILRHWIEEAAEFRGVGWESLIIETLYDHFHKLPASDGSLRIVNPLEVFRRERMHWEIFHESHNKRLTDETYIRIRGVPRSKTNQPYDVIKSSRTLQWDDYLALRAENIKALEKSEFDITKKLRKRKPRRTLEEMERDRIYWESRISKEELAKGRVLTTTSGLPHEIWLRTRAKD